MKTQVGCFTIYSVNHYFNLNTRLSLLLIPNIQSSLYPEIMNRFPEIEKPWSRTSTNETVQPFRLLDLPTEIRLMIYEHLSECLIPITISLTNSSKVVVEYHSTDNSPPRCSIGIWVRIDQGVLRARRLLEAEASPVVKRSYAQARLVNLRLMAEKRGWDASRTTVHHFACQWYDLCFLRFC
jgi:hypothetical protein